MAGASTKTTVKVGIEVTKNIPHPPFSVVLIGLNALFLLGSPLLLFLSNAELDAAFGVAFFVLPIALCYSFITHKSWSRWLAPIQPLAIILWLNSAVLAIPFALTCVYLFLGTVPKAYYRAISSDRPSDEDIALLAKWPKNTLSTMDWFSEIVQWIFVLAAFFLFASLFIPGLLLDYR